MKTKTISINCLSAALVIAISVLLVACTSTKPEPTNNVTYHSIAMKNGTSTCCYERNIYYQKAPCVNRNTYHSCGVHSCGQKPCNHKRCRVQNCWAGQYNCWTVR